MEILSKSTQDTKELARSLAESLTPGAVIALYGDLGSGKTTFTNFLVKALGFDSRVQSPTFVISRRYEGGKGKVKVVNHLDLYRLTSSHEATEVGLHEFFTEPDAITIIEWPEIVEDLLPKDTVRIRFEYAGDSERKINVQDLR